MELQRTLETLLLRRQSDRQYSSAAVPADALMRILQAGQGQRAGNEKRMAPSAHALYPLKLFVLVRRASDLEPGVYEFEPRQAELHRSDLNIAAGALLSVSLAGDEWLERAAVVVMITADIRQALEHFRDQQADGMRGKRYVDFEAGAAVQNMALSVAAQGLGGVVVMGIDEQQLKRELALESHMEVVTLYCIGVPVESHTADSA